METEHEAVVRRSRKQGGDADLLVLMVWKGGVAQGLELVAIN